jgi:hypothetical protein
VTAPVQLDRGAFVISIDTELAWGLAHRRGASVEDSHHFDREREVVAAILDVFAQYEIRATWAIVGHLFLDHCQPDAEGRCHPELARPDYPWLEEDWFAVDPGSSLDEAPYYYGRDIVERVAACPVEQEIASHAFSHVIAGDEGCTADVFASELTACQVVARKQGVELRSFVYPRNSIAHLESLAAAGFTNYRGPRPAPFAGSTGWRRRAAAVVDRVRPGAASAVLPSAGPAGLWNLPQTYLFAPATSRRRMPPALWARQPVARLRQAVRERSLFHLWFHPYNVTAAPERALDVLGRICAAADRLRDADRLDILTMGQLAQRLNRLMPA